ncbi:MAG: arsenic resistance N-acetyltransferase ArsN2 [Calditrichaceae bacterium]
MSRIRIKKIENKELDYGRKLLRENGLPYSDIENESVQIFSIQQDNQTIGIIGFERFENHGLLRSFVIEEKYRSKGLGGKILIDFERLASDAGIENFFLLTTTADKFFDKNGYQVYNRNAVPDQIANTTEFGSLCPQSAVCMKKKLC